MEAVVMILSLSTDGEQAILLRICRPLNQKDEDNPNCSMHILLTFIQESRYLKTFLQSEQEYALSNFLFRSFEIFFCDFRAKVGSLGRGVIPYFK